MSLESAVQLIESCAQDRVLFVGEGIRDVYNYVKPLGRPSKEVIMSVETKREDSFVGGVNAAAKAAASFCEVDVWSDRTITKLRYVEDTYFRKLFQVYSGVERLEDPMPVDLQQYRTVSVIDYGHGMLNEDALVVLQDESPFLAVNVQANSGNYGFNLATKYERCDYLVVDELEARLATQNQHGQIENSILELSAIAPKVIVTLGRDGAVGWTKETGLVRTPTHSRKVVDTIGAGDAFFAVTSILAERGDIQDLMMIGNAAGALKAGILGHSQTVSKDSVIEFLKA